MEFIDSYDQVEQLKSTKKPFFVFKHSTTCPISAHAREEFEAFLAESDVPYVAVRVIEERPVSNQIAESTGVVHQSPQAILLRGDEVLWNDSHRRLTKEAFKQAWNSHSNQ